MTSGKGGAPGKARAPRAGPRSVTRGLDVLRLIAAGGPGLGPTDIAESLGLPTSSLRSIIKSLEAGDYLSASQVGYVFGERAVSLAFSIRATASFPSALSPTLRALATTTGETVTLATPAEDRLNLIYLEVIESGFDLRTVHVAGSVEPILDSPSGHVMLAFMSEALLEQTLARVASSRATAFRRQRQILRSLPDIRASGHAASFDAPGGGPIGAAAAVFERAGALRCVVSVDGPASRILPRKHEIVATVSRAAEKMSKILGHQGAWPAPDAGAF